MNLISYNFHHILNTRTKKRDATATVRRRLNIIVAKEKQPW